MFSKVVSDNVSKCDVLNHVRGLDISRSWVVTVKRLQKRRTLPQNKLYWMWLTLLQDETGNDREDLHEYFIGSFLNFEEREIFGKTVYRMKRTSDLDTDEFSAYLQKIHDFALTINIFCPWPESDSWESFYTQYSERTNHGM